MRIIYLDIYTDIYIFRYIWDICAGWLAQGTGRSKVVTTPELVDTDEDVETVRVLF